jgi:thymidine kinase
MSLLTVIAGPMFAGKTEELQRRMRRVRIAGRAVFYIRPAVDRPQGARSHGGLTVEGVKVHAVSVDARTRPHVPAETALIVVDEAQFFDPDRLLAWVRHWRRRGFEVLIGGLDLDYCEEPFPVMAALLALADASLKLCAVCARCGSNARRSYRLSDETERVVIGNEYEPRCEPCFRLGSRL